MNQQSKEVKIQVKGSDATMAGVYANNFVVHMNRDEMVIDFVNLIPPAASLVSRTIMAPTHLKKLYEIIGETLKKYEKEFGALPEAPKKPSDEKFVQ